MGSSLDCAEELGIPGIVPFLDRMIVLDYIIANEDRHLNNFGALRNAGTLEWIGMAPVYDSGSSLGYDKNAAMIRSGSDIICKPFKRHHSEQLKLVTSFEWIDFGSLEGTGKMIYEILSEDDTAALLEMDRIKSIAESVEKRIREVEEFALCGERSRLTDLVDEVKENTAASYS